VSHHLSSDTGRAEEGREAVARDGQAAVFLLSDEGLREGGREGGREGWREGAKR
jgi:hypothetical protein